MVQKTLDCSLKNLAPGVLEAVIREALFCRTLSLPPLDPVQNPTIKAERHDRDLKTGNGAEETPAR